MSQRVSTQQNGSISLGDITQPGATTKRHRAVGSHYSIGLCIISLACCSMHSCHVLASRIHNMGGETREFSTLSCCQCICTDLGRRDRMAEVNTEAPYRQTDIHRPSPASLLLGTLQHFVTVPCLCLCLCQSVPVPRRTGTRVEPRSSLRIPVTNPLPWHRETPAAMLFWRHTFRGQRVATRGNHGLLVCDSSCIVSVCTGFSISMFASFTQFLPKQFCLHPTW